MPRSPKSKRNGSQRDLPPSQIKSQAGRLISPETTTTTFTDCLRNEAIRVVHASRALLEEGISLYGARADKEWSLTDCISFVVMRDEGIIQALTGDHHFEQAGFKALLC
jgi:predicted nucleic acid-binding protein